MHQILFRLPYFGTPVYGYGVMLVIGFFTALALAKYLARRSGLDPEIFVNAALIALVSGIVGARLSHVLENFHEFTRPDLSAWQNLKNIFNMRSGGLTYYGGFLLAFPLTVLYGIKKKVPLRLGMDIMAPCIVLGLGFGRIGCFLNGCCHGAECDLPWAVQFPYYSNAYQDQFADRERPLPVPRALIEEDAEGRPRLVEPDRHKTMGPQYVELASHERSRKVHPAQLYSTITAWLIAASLAAYFTLPHAPGRLFALMMMLEGGTRYLLEMLRTEPPVIGQHLSLSMIIGLGLVAGGAILWVAFGRYQGAGATTYGSALASTSAGGGGMPK